MRVARPVQGGIAGGDTVADPAFGMAGTRGGASGHDFGKGGVVRHLETAALQDLRERAREMKAVQRDDRPVARLHPEDFALGPRIGHRENAAAIGQQQGLRRNRGRGGRMHACADSNSRGRCRATLPRCGLPPRGARCLCRVLQGCSSAGRASVSKTEGHGFESCHPCHYLHRYHPHPRKIAWSAAADFRRTRWLTLSCLAASGEPQRRAESYQRQNEKNIQGGSHVELHISLFAPRWLDFTAALQRCYAAFHEARADSADGGAWIPGAPDGCALRDFAQWAINYAHMERAGRDDRPFLLFGPPEGRFEALPDRQYSSGSSGVSRWKSLPALRSPLASLNTTPDSSASARRLGSAIAALAISPKRHTSSEGCAAPK